MIKLLKVVSSGSDIMRLTSPDENVDIANFINNIVSNIKLSDNVKEHLAYTEESLLEYIDKLEKSPAVAVPLFLLDCNIKENIASSILEDALYSPEIIHLCEKKRCCDTNIIITQEDLYDINGAVLSNKDAEVLITDYRDCIAWVGRSHCTLDTASYVTPQPKYVYSLMEQFLDYYNSTGNTELDHPFIKSAIVNLVFIKIHPFKDGNGRISRLLHHHKLTELFNKRCNKKFEMPIINLSQHYDMTRGNYYQNENNVIFDTNMEKIINNNEAWNKWFNYVLSMMDENIYYLTNKLDYYSDSMANIDEMSKRSIFSR
jgi:hypothetical protein